MATDYTKRADDELTGTMSRISSSFQDRLLRYTKRAEIMFPRTHGVSDELTDIKRKLGAMELEAAHEAGVWEERKRIAAFVTDEALLLAIFAGRVKET